MTFFKGNELQHSLRETQTHCPCCVLFSSQASFFPWTLVKKKKKPMLNKKKTLYFFCMCIYVCGGVQEVRGQRAEGKEVSLLLPLLSLSIFCFESGSLPGVGARWFSWTDYLASFKDAHPAIYVGARDLDSGLYFTNGAISPTTYTNCLLISPDSASGSLAQKFFLVLKSTFSWVSVRP